MAADTNQATILLVDDDDIVRQVLSRVLTGEGYAVLDATGASDALELARQHPPDLAMLDLSLKDGDGVDLAGQLHARQAELPLILMTGYPLRLRERPELAGPFRRVLTKPLDLGNFRKTVRAVLSEEAMKPRTPRPQLEPKAPEPAPVPAAGADRPA